MPQSLVQPEHWMWFLFFQSLPVYLLLASRRACLSSYSTFISSFSASWRLFAPCSWIFTTSDIEEISYWLHLFNVAISTTERSASFAVSTVAILRVSAFLVNNSFVFHLSYFERTMLSEYVQYQVPKPFDVSIVELC